MRIPYDVPSSVGRQFIALTQEIAAAILRTLEAGWIHALSFPDVNAASGEVKITERLRDGMRQTLSDKRSPYHKTMIISLGTESRSRPDIISPDGRTDIPVYVIKIFLRYGDHDPHAIIECKRIAGSDANLCRAYVVEGIDRFRTGKYGGNHRTGFMAGYLLSGDAAGAAAGVNRYLSGKRRHTEHLRPSRIVEDAWVWESRHPRTAPPPIDLHHAFLRLQVAPC